MNYWLFQCNPDRYRFEDNLSQPNPFKDWLVTRYKNQISEHDVAFVWFSGKNRAVRAVLDIQSNPGYSPDDPTEINFWRDPNDKAAGRMMRVKTHLRSKGILPLAVIKQDPILSKMTILQPNHARGTNFLLTQQEGLALLGQVQLAGFK